MIWTGIYGTTKKSKTVDVHRGWKWSTHPLRLLTFGLQIPNSLYLGQQQKIREKNSFGIEKISIIALQIVVVLDQGISKQVFFALKLLCHLYVDSYSWYLEILCLVLVRVLWLMVVLIYRITDIESKIMHNENSENSSDAVSLSFVSISA